VRRLLSVTEALSSPAALAFDPDSGWRVHPQIALRDESFGALAYHFGTRRLMFLKSRTLVELVTALAHYDTAQSAVDALIPVPERPTYLRALARLAASEVIDVR
jgi:mycofactocin biosynthesis protein MftB